MNTKIIGTVIGLTIAIILVATILMPVLEDDSMKNKVTYTNTGDDYFKEVDGATVSIDLSDGVAVTIDDESITVDEYGVIVATDTFMLVRATDAINMFCPIDNAYILAGSTEASYTLTMADGAYTATASDKTITGTYTKALVKTTEDDADYLHQNTGSVNTGAETVMYVGSVLWGAAQGVGTIEDLTSGSQSYSLKTIEDYSVSASTDATVTWEVYDNGNGSYDVSEFTDSEGTTPINTFIPLEYYVYEDTAISTLAGAIAPMMIIAILMGAVGLVAKRD